jgi:hypothetical protein
MTFDQAFKVDEAIPYTLPEVIAGRVSAVGTFEDGLFSMLDESLSNSVLSSWRWLLGQDAVALVASALGDLFFWSEKHKAVYFLEVQRGKSTFVDKDVGFFLNHFLVRDGVLESVLNRDLFKSLTGHLGKLKYGECYIAEPWLRLGGSGDVNTYEKGDLAVYAVLVGQAVEQAMRLERSRVR